MSPRSPARQAEALRLPVLLALGALDAAGYSVIAPGLPAIARDTGLGPAAMGAMAGSFPAAMLVALPIAGRLVRAGRLRQTLVASVLVVIGGSLAFAAQLGIPGLFVARAVMGFGSGGLWMCVTLATLAYWPGQEYRLMARLYAAYSVGALLGPALGATGGVARPFLLYGVLVALLGLLAALLPPTPQGLFVPDRTALRTRSFWVASVAIMMAISAAGLLDGVLPLHLAARLSQPQIGITYVGAALLIAVGSIAAARYPPWPAVATGGLGIIVGVVLIGATGTVWPWLAGLALVGLGAGLSQTGATGLLLARVPTERITSAMAVWSQVAMLGYLAGPAIGGVLAERLGFAWLGAIPLLFLLVVGALRAFEHR
ncbi:MAG: MFS transporter [Nocardioidaceae bacterium]